MPDNNYENKPEGTAKSQEEKIRILTGKLENGVREIFSSEKYQEWLKVCSRFHHYSINNQILISMQKPDASQVASYTTWRSLNRYVEKGQKGIEIICPAPKKIHEVHDKIDPLTGEKRLDAHGKPEKEIVEKTIPCYKVGYVFDISQTGGKELPTLVNNLEGTVDSYDRMIDALQAVSPVPVSFERIDGSANGYYHLDDKRIVVKHGLSEQQTVKTLIHEITHASIHDYDVNAAKTEPTKLKASDREIEAESVAFVVSQYYGIDSSQYTFGYISGWAENRDLSQLKNSMETIRKTSANLIEKLDRELNPFKSIENTFNNSQIKNPALVELAAMQTHETFTRKSYRR